MSETVHFAGRACRLDDKDLLGIGGEGRVYRAHGRAIKIFFRMTDARRDKLASFPRGLPPAVVGPLEPCTDPAGAVVGYAMRLVEGAVDMHKVATKKWQRGALSPRGVLGILRDLGATVAAIHRRGVVVGDLNDGNVVLERSPSGVLSPCFIDADSMQYAGFPCVVAHERFLDPRLYGADLAKSHALSTASDFYALAVMAFTTLLFVHPFGGAHPAYPTLLRRAEARCSLLHDGVTLPAAALRPDVLPDDALAWFARVFEQDLREPLPAALLDAQLTPCACGAAHARRACPMCTAQAAVPSSGSGAARLRREASEARATEIVRGHVVAAALEGGLAFVVEKDGALVREDGRALPRLAGSHLPRVRISGRSTWLLGPGRAERALDGAVVESIPIGVVHGEPAADAGAGGLVYVAGAALVRATDGTRLGAVLEDQTHVRVGASLGFAFYRAGSFTVAFVFDVRQGPLRQLELPHLTGRLVEWDCAFDDDHVLFSAATEKDGRLVHEAHLFDARGTRLASTRGAPGSSAVLAQITGKCLARGAILAATDDGLALIRADRSARAFDTVRAFPETRALVPADAELVTGPGGSVYVLTHESLVHLRST